MKNSAIIFTVLILFGCAARVPLPVSKTPVANVSVAEVRADGHRFDGTVVRWGGEIARVDNKAKETWIEIVSRQLRTNGQPRQAGKSSGRFIASFQGFRDPVVYQVGQSLTVLGPIKGQVKRPIGEHDYSFPMVSATASVLWQVEPEPAYYEYPPPFWYYDPWPYYPWSHPHHYW